MKNTFLIILLLSISISVFSQKYTISGYIEDAETGERLINANVYDADNLSTGTISNVYGFYSLTIPKQKINLTSSFVGYTSMQLTFNLTKDTVINFKLPPSLQIEEVVVTGERTVENPQMSQVNVPLRTIKTMPVLLGEVDVLKTIQLLPGVQSGTEGTSGIYVRGGGPDQNLILLDGVPVYNVNHLFGFFSIFNADAISDVSLIKGGFPARYGGRLSSVLDIRMKEGNMYKYDGSVSIGLISSKATFEGPIIKGKSSFIITARRTYIDILAQPVLMLIPAVTQEFDKFRPGYFFHDINAKVNYKFSDKDRLFLSMYAGKDKVYAHMKETWEEDIYETNFNLNWGNIITSLRWNHVFTPKLFCNVTATYSRFNFLTEMEYKDTWTQDNTQYSDHFKMGYSSGIDDVGGRVDFDFIPGQNYKIKFGGSGTFHTFRPGITAMSMSDTWANIDTTYGNKNIYAREFTAYMENQISIGKKFKINIGGNLSFFNVRDTTFISPEPRISARFLITKNWSIKAAYSQMQQYLHLLSSSTIGLPTDLWLPATNITTPQHSTQYAVGTVFSLTKQINFSIEGFYKTMDNLVEFKEGESMFSDIDNGEMPGDAWESKIEQGKGWAYGFEFLLKKDLGKLSGWLGYTLSWTEREFENIAFGERFPYRYDRRHDISIVIIYKINDHIDAGLTWVFGTGNAVTLAQQRYMSLNDINNYTQQMQNEPEWAYISTVEYYGKRNNYRLPPYHRLDLGINFSKQKKHGVRTWSIGVYNAYSRRNPFFVQFERNWKTDERALMQYSLFPIIPSISYKFEF